MIVYVLRCQGCGSQFESSVDRGHCSCGKEAIWFSMVQRDAHGVDPSKRMQTGYKIAPDLSPQQQAHIESPEVQAKLKSGEYAPIRKGSDEWNHR